MTAVLDLKKLTLFRELTLDELRDLEPYVSVQTQPKGWILFREGTRGRVLYVVKSGRVGVFKNHGTPSEVELGSTGADAVLGEISLLLDTPRAGTAVVTSEESELISITSVIMDNIMRHKPAAAAKMLRVLLEQSMKRTLDLDKRLVHLEGMVRSLKGIAS